jgi:VIT1/CCC1 family predicted Fe2+/Mn2+ transporter
MCPQILDQSILRQIRYVQREEITVQEIYSKIAFVMGNSHNSNVLKRIASEELEHYGFWKKYTASDVSPDRLRVLISILLLRILGYTFTLKFLASRHARDVKMDVIEAIPDAETILRKDEAHKKEIIALTDLLDEERFRYIGAIVLGLNDAMVEFIGMLAGLTFALQDSKLIMITVIVAGISASISMAASEYLSQRSEEKSNKRLKPARAAIYTGITYLITVALLLFPFIVIKSPYIALLLTLTIAFIIIFGFTFYLSVAKSLNFRGRFTEMALLSLGVATLSFFIGLGARLVLHVTV